MTATLLAFHGDAAIKAEYLARVKAHAVADEIVQGRYWEDGKGCVVGCAIHGGDHDQYEKLLGIPDSMLRLQDKIFEGLTPAEARTFPVAFLEAIPVGADLNMVTLRFLHCLLADPEHGVVVSCAGEAQQAVQGVIALYERFLNGEAVLLAEWDAADAAALAARVHAADAAAAAARAACVHAVESDTAYAADAAAEGDPSAYAWQKAKLLELLAEAPVVAAA